MAKCIGDFDGIMSITLNNLDESDTIKDNIPAYFDKHIASKSIAISSKVWVFPKNYLLGFERKLSTDRNNNNNNNNNNNKHKNKDRLKGL